MVISKSHPNWPLLIEGKINHKFQLVSASMLLSRLTRDYKSNPTPSKMDQSIDEAISFFSKYQNLFQDDLTEIFK